MGSGTIRVLKRAGSVELFDTARLRLSMWRAMRGDGGSFDHADQLAEAIGVYLRRSSCGLVTSRALLEMALRALRQTGQVEAADTLEAHDRQRHDRRQQLTLGHEGRRRSRWDRDWLTGQIRHRWDVGLGAARALSAEIESELLARGGCVDRAAVLNRVDERIAAYGLASHCPLTTAGA